MATFNHYARYYDLLYRDKDYAGEARFVSRLLEEANGGGNTRTILDLGCGTGSHARALGEMGYHVTGVDVSGQMIQVATDRHSMLGAAVAKRVEFVCGDIRSVRLERTYDAVVALFHVLSYQTSNSDLEAAFETVRVHLRPEGAFMFDCWYGPAVLRELPSPRIKRVEDDVIRVTRIANPVVDVNRNVVNVGYELLIRDKRTGSTEEVNETHSMRYLFRPEVQGLLESNGMRCVDFREWMSDRKPGVDSWNVCFVGKGAP